MSVGERYDYHDQHETPRGRHDKPLGRCEENRVLPVQPPALAERIYPEPVWTGAMLLAPATENVMSGQQASRAVMLGALASIVNDAKGKAGSKRPKNQRRNKTREQTAKASRRRNRKRK